MLKCEFLETVPFLTVLILISISPFMQSIFLRRNFEKLLLIPCIMVPFFSCGDFDFFHVLLRYTSFIIFISSCYIITGGILINLEGKPTALINSLILGCGSLLAGVIGTTGASVLLIRPFLKFNMHRKKKNHLVVFFIFLISNVGGALSSFGDPPLFVGFLNGIDFLWPTKRLAIPVLALIIALLGIFYLIDTGYREKSEKISIKINGGVNIILITFMLGLIIGISFFNDNYGIRVIRDIILIFITLFSLWYTPKHIKEANQFNLRPLYEIAIIFFAIFITLTPVEKFLHTSFTNFNGEFSPFTCFWMSGLLSVILDNTPSYMIFFDIFGGNPKELMTLKEPWLIAVSLGSVLMGAMTYVGNAPNLLVYFISKSYTKQAPSFLGYMVWSCFILLPLLLVLSWLVFLIPLFY